MFSPSNSTASLLPQFSPLFYTSSSLLGLTNNEIFLHSCQDLLSSHHVAVSGNTGAETGVQAKKNSRRKDRHSKICTAQGIRDRRVRLSIGVARRFFDLQDMLGFAKASETLDWLLSNSRAAIKEAQMALPSHVGGDPMSDEVPTLTDKRKDGETSHLLRVRESRRKARARARERTRSKKIMCNARDVGDQGYFNAINPDLQLRSRIQGFEVINEVKTREIVDESTMKMKPNSSISGFQNNFSILVAASLAN